jgi:phosphatidylglycerol:prolipoprotein diacylglycerol transferase
VIVHPNFDPVALSIGPLSIHWYGLMYLFGFGAGLLLGQSRAKSSQSDWNPDEVIDFLFFIAMGVIIGGRLGYVVFYNLQFYLSNPLDVFALWDGGMSFHGGLIGVIVAIAMYARKTEREYMAVADFLAPLIPPGLFFGRIGNFINQELWGRATDLPWGVLFYTAPNQPRHPSQLYEALLEGLVLFIVLWIFSRSKRATGQITGLFLVLYGVFRFFIEFFREPDDHIGTIAFNWLTMGQLLCLPMIVLGLYFVFRSRFNNP